jgi:hypothetical protein
MKRGENIKVKGITFKNTGMQLAVIHYPVFVQDSSVLEV